MLNLFLWQDILNLMLQASDCIVVTGAAGFIGSALVALLNQQGYDNLILVDDFSAVAKQGNLVGKGFAEQVHRDVFDSWLGEHAAEVKAIFHLGARTDTTLMDKEVFDRLNLEYSKNIWRYCASNNIPLVYASSAATYGDGAQGYDDDQSKISQLVPLNPYGWSKQEFDIWALVQEEQPPFWAGLKFFNVYGPNEYHKGRMASVVFHAFNTLQQGQKAIKLFRSHRPDFEDGGQMRDFIYVKDVIKVCYWLMQQQPQSGIFNLGTGKARTFADLARSVFAALDVAAQIEYIDTPLDIRDKYQYFTEANMSKLQQAGYGEPFYSLEQGVREYVQEYLIPGKYY